MNIYNDEYLSKSPLVIKSGTTDLRRSERTLTELAEKNYSEGLKVDTLYAFSNKSKSTIKIVKLNNDASITMIKLKREKPYPWIAYKEKGTDGYTVELNGTEKRKFLKEIGCPENL